MSLNRAIMAVLLLAGCSEEPTTQLVDEDVDIVQAGKLKEFERRIEKLEQMQKMEIEAQLASQPQGKTGMELLEEHNKEKKVDERIRALEDHQY